MLKYPTSPKISKDSSGETIKEAIRTESEAGYTMSRPRYTRTKESFNLVYQSILISDYLILKNFFKNNQGKSFLYENPIDGIEYEVIFNMDKLPYNLIGAGRCSTSVSLLEV